MSDHFDRLENRTPAARESLLFRDLRHVISVSKARVPALRTQLKGVDVATLVSRAELARIPVRRMADLVTLQADSPPLGGTTATRIGNLRQAFHGPASIGAVEGHAKDWWGFARALFATGLRKGDVVLNCFSYDLVPDGHMAASGALAIGCPIVPAGNAAIGATIDAALRFRPVFYCGPAARLKHLLDAARERDANLHFLENALVTGPMKAGLRNELSLRGVKAKQAFFTPELGLVAFESGATDGMVVNEGQVVEVVGPGTDTPVADGETGEIVVSRINLDFPLVRFGTGATARILAQPSTCGRTNMRISTPQWVSESSITHSALLEEIVRRHPNVGRMRLARLSDNGHDELHLTVEHASDAHALRESIAATLSTVTQMRGTVELVAPGTIGEAGAGDGECLPR